MTQTLATTLFGSGALFAVIALFAALAVCRAHVGAPPAAGGIPGIDELRQVIESGFEDAKKRFGSTDAAVKALEEKISGIEQRAAALRLAGGGGGDKPKTRILPILNQMRKVGTRVEEISWKGLEREKELQDHARSLVAGTDSAGGVLITPETDPAMIELLRAESVVDSMGISRRPNLKGSPYTMRKLTGGATHVWGSEGVAPAASQPGFGSVDMNPKRSTAYVPVSNQLLRQADMSVEQIVREDIAIVCALAWDLARLRGTGGIQPLGVRGQVGITVTALNAAPTLKDLWAAILVLENANAFRQSVGWILSPRDWNTLRQIKDGTGRYILDPLSKTLLGLPYKTTTQIPTNLNVGGGGAVESEIYLGNWKDFVEADWGPLEIAASDVAGGPTGSAFLQDETWFRAIRLLDFALRQPLSFVVLSQTLVGA